VLSIYLLAFYSETLFCANVRSFNAHTCVFAMCLHMWQSPYKLSFRVSKNRQQWRFTEKGKYCVLAGARCITNLRLNIMIMVHGLMRKLDKSFRQKKTKLCAPGRRPLNNWITQHSAIKVLQFVRDISASVVSGTKHNIIYRYLGIIVRIEWLVGGWANMSGIQMYNNMTLAH